MEKAIYNTVYNRRKKLLSDGTALIQIEAYMRGKNKYFSTKIYITPDQWDKKHHNIKNHPNKISLNKQIKDFANQLEKIELDKRQSGKPFDLNTLTQSLKGVETNSFLDFMSKEIEQNNQKQGTQNNHRATLKTLRDFRKDILFSELNFELLCDLENYLKNKIIKEDGHLHPNTIHKYFRHIKKFVNLAINKGLFELNRYPFRKFTIKTEPSKREYLTPEQFQALEALKIEPEKEHLQKVLDMFLFACYTGLRFSDITSLSKDCIVIEDGKTWIKTTQTKTGTPLSIPIYLLFDGKPIELLKKYTKPDRNFIFDELTNQYINRCLKDIAEMAGIHKTVTFHVARHTQATFLLYKGLPITTLQKLLGHKKLSTTQIYSKVMDMTVVNELQNISFTNEKN